MKNILVPTDFSDSASGALEQAVKLATLSGGRITLLHVIFLEKIKDDLLGLDALENLARVLNTPSSEATHTPTNAVDTLTEAAQQRLKEAAAKAGGGVKIDTAVAQGRPSVEVVKYAGENGVDLIVMGTHGRSPIGRAFLGSVADNVIRQAECPVMVVR
ncbi:MAG TPA: universal stress protein, partial [Lacipirellula sp.]